MRHDSSCAAFALGSEFSICPDNALNAVARASVLPSHTFAYLAKVFQGTREIDAHSDPAFVVALDLPHGDWRLSTIDVPDGYSEGGIDLCPIISNR